MNPYKNYKFPNKLEDVENKRGIRMYIHGKPHPDPVFYGDRKPNFFHKIVFEEVGRNDPYALIDNNLRELKRYVENDVKPFYDENGNPNIDKKDPQEYNTYVVKEMLFEPSNLPQTGWDKNNKALNNNNNNNKGGRSKKSNRKTKKGLKKRLKKRKNKRKTIRK